MKTTLLFFILLFTCLLTTAQVKIGGSNTVAVHPNAVLELESSNKGLLLPRLGLAATTNPYPLASFTAGIIVYDTATIADITPGVYYCDGTKWIKVNNTSAVTPSPEGGWSLKGNSNTDPAQNFLGTLDANDMVFRTNNKEQLRLTKDGWLGVGTATPNAALHVKGQVIIDSLQAGDIQKDSILVADASGRIKSVSPTKFYTPAVVKKTAITVAQNGVASLTTPAPITDIAKIMLYRNGVMISFTITGTNTIAPEMPCKIGDEINIVQTL